MRYLAVLLPSLLTTVGIPPTSAQTVLDRVVGTTESGAVTLSELTGQQVAILGRAAGVPMGFEGVLPRAPRFSIRATRRPLRAVLDALIEADPRYEWREDAGVIVLRPIAAWADDTSPLHAALEGLTLDNITAGDALDVLARMVGVRPPSIGLDTRRFSLQVRPGATWLEALNAIVREHGALTWTIAPSNPYRAEFPLGIMLNIGASGVGFGVPADAVLSRDILVSRPEPVPESSILDRIVGTGHLGEPIRAHTVNQQLARDVADAVGVPIGFESLRAAEPRAWLSDGVSLSGMTLQQALAVLVALDPRYEWRDANGVIVLRPVNAWLASDNPLFQLVPAVQLQHVPASKAIAKVSALLSAPHQTEFPDTRAFSVDVPRGTLFDLLNAISRAHGELSWAWEEIPADEKNLISQGLRHRITFSVRRGVAHGHAVP